jgi:hypothetical protein
LQGDTSIWHYPDAVSDKIGGAIAFWLDTRSVAHPVSSIPVHLGIYAQRISRDGVITSIPVLESSKIPEKMEISQNYPNPFNPETHINYSIPDEGIVKIIIYDSIGRLVKTLVEKKQMKGHYSVIWDGKSDNGKSVSSGIYFYKFLFNQNLQTNKMILLH